MWSPQHRSLTVVTIASLSLSNVILLFAFVVAHNTQPEAVAAIKSVSTELKMSTDTTRSMISFNRREIDRLREQMKFRTEQLRRANQAILKLDPTYKIEEPHDDF